MGRRWLALLVGAAAATSVAATEALAGLGAEDESPAGVPGTGITIDLRDLLGNDKASVPLLREAAPQGYFLTSRSRGIQFARIDSDRTITIRFRAGFTDTSRFRSVINGDSLYDLGSSDFSRVSAVFKVPNES